MTEVTVDDLLEQLLEVPGDWLVNLGEHNVIRATSPERDRFAFLHTDGRPITWLRYRQRLSDLTVRCPTCLALVGERCTALETGHSTILHVARRRALEALENEEKDIS
jgi:hypothetical protein